MTNFHHLKFSLLFVSLVLLTLSCKKGGIFDQINQTEDSSRPNIIRPNIIIILADDIGYDAIASNGNESFQTPNIDLIGQRGMRFTHCYGSPLCSPSRVAFVSGKYNFRNYTQWGIFDPTGKTFANIAKEAGYATYVAGKWEFDGGDVAVHRMGFDGYCIWNPFHQETSRHYKTPHIYENGAFLPDSVVSGKYGDDIFTSRVLSFINQNRNKNFFVYFPITLCHGPYSPTPDDPEYATWDEMANQSDVKYFPSMMKYMDKKIGEVIDSLQAWNLYNNTIVIFAGDNGTPHDIFYYFDGKYTEGNKSSTTDGGTRVALFAQWPDRVSPGQVNRNLIESGDFLPTVADAVKGTITPDYGIIDGHSFYPQLTNVPQLTGEPYTPRSWIFNHYEPNSNNGNTKTFRWVQDTTYKLYDSTDKFFNVYLDPEETHRITPGERTEEEKALAQRFEVILDSLK
jgi:arylsulfatase A